MCILPSKKVETKKYGSIAKKKKKNLMFIADPKAVINDKMIAH